MGENKCWQCLRTTEALMKSGKWGDFKPPLRDWYEMSNAEEGFLKKALSEQNPTKVLEIGAGAGRIVELILSNSKAEVVALEKNDKIRILLKQRFEGNKRVKVPTSEKGLENEKFDLVLCTMNTLGDQEDENSLIKFALSVSNKMIFTVYEKGCEETRRGAYKILGHDKMTEENGCFHFHDDWIKGTFSKSYSKKELEEMCNKLGKAKIHKINKLSFLVEIEK